MTVSSNPFPIRYSGDGSTLTFPVSGYFLAELDGTAHLLVTVRDADGNETTQTQGAGADYTVGGAGNPSGGSITFATAPTATETVVITRNVPDTQETDYIEYDDFPAESHERGLDKLTMRHQQRANDLDRALLLGITDVSGTGSYRAGGNRIENLGTPTEDTDAATKSYVDIAVGTGGGGGGGGGVTDHGALTGLADDDHTQYHNDARGDARYYQQSQVDTLLAGKADASHNHAATDITSGTFADARIAESNVTQHEAAITVATSQITNFGEAVDDQVNTLLVAGANVSLTYDDGANTLTIASTGGGGGTVAWGSVTGTLSDQTDLQTALDSAEKWDLPSLETDYSGVGDGVTDNSTPVTNALAAGAFYVPEGTFDTASLAPADLGGRFYGDGQILTSDNYKRGRFFSLIEAAPSSTSNRDSIQQAFNGDISAVQFPVEHRITGAATMGQPTTGYSYRHECYPHFTYLRNESGHNQSTSGNDGRTGTCAYQTKVDQWGQGDAVAYNALVYVGSTKSGSTDFLANPAGVILNGSIIAGVDGAYLNTVEFDMQDNGFDAAGVGIVTNMKRTVGTGAKNAIWMGARYQSLGTTDVDAGISFSGAGGFKVGIDFTPATLDGSQPAMCLKSGQRIFLNATAGTWYKATNGGESLYYNGSSVVIGAGNVGILQARASELDIAPSGSIKFRCNTSGATVVTDFKVASSVGGSNYFRVQSSEVNCSVQLKVNDIIDIYNGTLAAGKTALGSYLRIRLGGVDRYLALYN